MLRPIPAPHARGPLFQDLLTLGPRLPNRTVPHLPLAGATALQAAIFADSVAPFILGSPGRSFVPQHPLGQVPAPAQDATAPLDRLETRLARLLQLPDVVTFASSDAALRSAMGAILRPGDGVILDAALTSAMLETVLTQNAQPYRSPAGSFSGIERRLHRLASTPGAGRLWVAVPAISAYASTIADLADLADLCQHYGAGLIVDVTQDIGLTGQFGGGVMEVQGCLGRADVLLGSFARSFGAPGGFVGLRTPDLARHLRQSIPAKLAPPDAAKIMATLDLVESDEGQRRRRRLRALSLRLRNQLHAERVPVMGQASPIVPVRLQPQTALACTALMQSAGIGVSLVQSPTVATHAPRWCLHLTANHAPADIDDLAELIRDATRSLARQ